MKVPPLIINLKDIEKHKEHKKHKKHKKHKHRHHHQELKDEHPPLLEPVGVTEHHLFPFAPPSPMPYPDVVHPVPTPPSQANQLPMESEEVTINDVVGQPPILEPSLSFLEPTDDGSVRLHILVPTTQPDEGNEKILNLEQVCGQLQDGLDVIPSDINEKDCKEQLKVNPVECIEPPTFGSHLPIEDSTFANLTKEESETLMEVYGGNTTAFEYAMSLQSYAGGTTYLMKMVDSLLDLLTEGRHNKEAVPIRQAERKEPDDEVQRQLDEVETLLDDLRKMQEQRLSSSPAPVEPEEEETKLANNILQRMTKLIKDKAKPSEICESSSILKALGIPLDTQS